MTDLATEARVELMRWKNKSVPLQPFMVAALEELATDLELSEATDLDELEAFREERARRNIRAAGNVVDLRFPAIQAERVAFGQAGCLEPSEERG